MRHVEAISNGMGSQSMMLLVLAAEGEIPATISITADTGSELDCLWSNGERTTAREYFDRIIEPYARAHGIAAVFVRALDRNKEPLPPLIELLESGSTAGVPLFGSGGGRLMQACTSKYKIRAVRQELRRRGATTARVALGLTISETERMKPSDVQWCENWWPLIDRRLYRSEIQDALNGRDIPYLITTECDMCPHKDWSRWSRTTSAMIGRVAAIEEGLPGQFFTAARIPLKEALEAMERGQGGPTLFDSCDSGYCFI